MAAFEYGVDKVMKQLRTCIRNASTAPLKLKAIVDYYQDYIHDSPISGGCPIINTSIEADDDHPKLRAKVIRIHGIMKDSIKKIIHRGIVENQIRKNLKVDEFATMYYATIEGAIVMSRIEGDDESYKAIKNQLFQLIDSFTIN